MALSGHRTMFAGYPLSDKADNGTALDCQFYDDGLGDELRHFLAKHEGLGF